MAQSRPEASSWRSKHSKFGGAQVLSTQLLAHSHAVTGQETKPSRFFSTIGVTQQEETENSSGAANEGLRGAAAGQQTVARQERHQPADQPAEVPCPSKDNAVGAPHGRQAGISAAPSKSFDLEDFLDLPEGGLELQQPAPAVAAPISSQPRQWQKNLDDFSVPQAASKPVVKKGFAAAQRRGTTNLLRHALQNKTAKVMSCVAMDCDSNEIYSVKQPYMTLLRTVVAFLVPFRCSKLNLCYHGRQ